MGLDPLGIACDLIGMGEYEDARAILVGILKHNPKDLEARAILVESYGLEARELGREITERLENGEPLSEVCPSIERYISLHEKILEQFKKIYSFFSSEYLLAKARMVATTRMREYYLSSDYSPF